MNEPPPACNFFPQKLFGALVFSLLIAFSFSSCSEDKMAVSSVDSMVIFDYPEKGRPQTRLSVFVEARSNVRRVDYITVKTGEYTWNIESPLMIEGGGKTWAGYMHLEPPPTLARFPRGVYSIETVDSSGEKAQSSFSVQYSDSLLETESDGVLSILSNPRMRLAVYSETGELLFFNKIDDDMTNDKKIFRKVKDSAYYRRTYTSGSTICLMPKNYKDGGQPDGRE